MATAPLLPLAVVAHTILPHSCMCNGQAEAVVLQPPAAAPAIPLHCISCQVNLLRGQPMAQTALALPVRQLWWKVLGCCQAFYHLEAAGEGEAGEGEAGARSIIWLPPPWGDLERVSGFRTACLNQHEA